MNIFYALGLAMLLVTPAFAQDPATPPTAPPPPAEPRWRNSFKSSLNLTESLLSSNWRGGGVNAIGLSTFANYQAHRKVGKNSFDNEADFLYAFTSTKGLGFRKTQDRLFLDTKYGHALSDKWDLFASLNLLTQFGPGYKYTKNAAGEEEAALVSRFFAPGFVTMAYGFEYHPVSYFHLRLAPFSPRLTVVQNPELLFDALGPRPYGVAPGASSRWEVLAGQILAEFDKNISPNVNLKARYMAFANYETLEFKKIDHRLDVNVTAKVGKYLNVGLSGIALYDYDQDNDLQYSQGLTMGLAYSFQNFVDAKK